jgi:hypothetical protein
MCMVIVTQLVTHLASRPTPVATGRPRLTRTRTFAGCRPSTAITRWYEAGQPGSTSLTGPVPARSPLHCGGQGSRRRIDLIISEASTPNRPKTKIRRRLTCAVSAGSREPAPPATTKARGSTIQTGHGSGAYRPAATGRAPRCYSCESSLKRTHGGGVSAHLNLSDLTLRSKITAVGQTAGLCFTPRRPGSAILAMGDRHH